MTPDKEPHTYHQDIKLGNGTIAVGDREFPAQVIRLTTTVRQFRAGNGEVCHQEKLSTRITVLS